MVFVFLSLCLIMTLLTLMLSLLKVRLVKLLILLLSHGDDSYDDGTAAVFNGGVWIITNIFLYTAGLSHDDLWR